MRVATGQYTSITPATCASRLRYASAVTGWPFVAQDPVPLLSLGLCSRGWLDRALPTLIDAADPSLRLEDGPPPRQVAPYMTPGPAAHVAGYFASRAGLPAPPNGAVGP